MGVIRDRARRSTPGWFHVRGGTITFGTSVASGGKGDVILSRTALDVLTVASDDTFSAAGGIITKEATGGATVATLGTVGAIQVQVKNGTAGIIFRATGTTYWISGT